MKIEIGDNLKTAIIAISIAAGVIAYFWCMTSINVPVCQ
jgi:hypothetical protein